MAEKTLNFRKNSLLLVKNYPESRVGSRHAQVGPGRVNKKFSTSGRVGSDRVKLRLARVGSGRVTKKVTHVGHWKLSQNYF
jgi:hypothetical protein